MRPPTFFPGTYALTAIGEVPTDLFYSLTITPETSTAPTPQPSAMALFGTGVLGLIGFVRIKRGQALSAGSI